MPYRCSSCLSPISVDLMSAVYPHTVVYGDYVAHWVNGKGLATWITISADAASLVPNDWFLGYQGCDTLPSRQNHAYYKATT